MRFLALLAVAGMAFLATGCGPELPPEVKAWRDEGFMLDSYGNPVGYRHASSSQMTIEEMKAIFKLEQRYGSAVGQKSNLTGIKIKQSDVDVAHDMHAAYTRAKERLEEIKWEKEAERGY